MIYEGRIDVGMVFECVDNSMVSMVIGDTRTVSNVPPRYLDVGFTSGKNLPEEIFRRAMRPIKETP